WQTNSQRQRLRKLASRQLKPQRCVRRADRARVGHADLVLADVRAGAPAVLAKADASSSAARRFASSVSRRLTALITRTCACSRSSFRRPARSYLGAYLAFAHRTSAGWPTPLSRHATLRCCLSAEDRVQVLASGGQSWVLSWLPSGFWSFIQICGECEPQGRHSGYEGLLARGSRQTSSTEFYSWKSF